MSLHQSPFWQCFLPLFQSEMVPSNVNKEAKRYTHVSFMTKAKINNAAALTSTPHRRRALCEFSKISVIQVATASRASVCLYVTTFLWLQVKVRNYAASSHLHSISGSKPMHLMSINACKIQ